MKKDELRNLLNKYKARISLRDREFDAIHEYHFTNLIHDIVKLSEKDLPTIDIDEAKEKGQDMILVWRNYPYSIHVSGMDLNMKFEPKGLYIEGEIDFWGFEKDK
jgi:hypothetical protein